LPATHRAFEDALVWARGLDDADLVWAIEDCRHVSGALEPFLLAHGEPVVRVPPKLLAGARNSARERGNSDLLDAVAIARAAIREGLDTLPVAQLAGPELDVRLLVDHRERLVAQRTALINDLRWQLHDLWPEDEVPPRALITSRWQNRVGRRLGRCDQTARVRIARDELRRIRDLARAITELEHELATLVARLAPRLLAERGCGVLTAAKLIGEIAGVSRFQTDAKLARAPPQRRSPHPPDAPTGTAWTAAATAKSTGPCTASQSPRPASTPRPPPTSPANKPKARADAKRCAASNATSRAESSSSCSQHRRQHRPRSDTARQQPPHAAS